MLLHVGFRYQDDYFEITELMCRSLACHDGHAGFTSFWGPLFLIRNNENMSKALIAGEYGRNRIRLVTHLAQNPDIWLMLLQLRILLFLLMTVVVVFLQWPAPRGTRRPSRTVASNGSGTSRWAQPWDYGMWMNSVRAITSCLGYSQPSLGTEGEHQVKNPGNNPLWCEAEEGL